MIPLPCYLVLSVPGTLATVLIKPFHFLLSIVASLSSAKFIAVFSSISSIHFFLGLPCFLLPSPYANIISFSKPSDRMTCPKNLSFAFSIVCCSLSSFSIPISMRTELLVLFSIHDILCIFLHIYISHALIFFFIFLVIVHVSLPYVIVGMIRAFTNLFFVSILTCLSFHIFSKPFIVAFPIATLRFISITLQI